MKLNAIFTDNVVLAEKKPIRIFGEGDGEATVRFTGYEKTVRSHNGKWVAELPPQTAGGPYELTASLNGETVTVRNVYVGAVYLISGQSNAEFRLCESNTDKSEYKDDGLLRCYFVKRPWIGNDVLEQKWTAAEKNGVGNWSAIGYLVGKKIREERGCAVGVVSCFQGASIIESWLPEEKAKRFSLPAEELHIDHTYHEYTAWNKNGVIYEKMLSQLFPFSFNGVIWYQGESDTTESEAKIYKDELECLISTVREKTGDESLPFVIVQIADFDPRRDDGWRGVQAAQEKAAAEIKSCALAPCRDVCETDAIHPPTKSVLAVRIAEKLL